MTPLNVITLAQAKTYLVMDGINDRDAEITRLIETAISLVEQYTCYRLYEREETFIAVTCHNDLPYYPIAIDSVIKDAIEQDYKETQGYLSLNVRCSIQSIITATVGYSDITLIPPSLIQACYKIITYLFENKDAYEATMPYDVQLLLNQWRRSATV